MNFTVEETNLIDIYRGKTRTEVLEKLRFARPLYEDAPELLAVLDSAVRKLAAMTDAGFLETAFVPAVPVLFDEEFPRMGGTAS